MRQQQQPNGGSRSKKRKAASAAAATGQGGPNAGDEGEEQDEVGLYAEVRAFARQRQREQQQQQQPKQQQQQPAKKQRPAAPPPAAAAPPPPPPPPQAPPLPSAPPPCRFFAAGLCRQGARCPFPHTMMQATRLAVVCRFHASGRGCAKGGGGGAIGPASTSGCPFSHDAICPVEYCRAELTAPGSCRPPPGPPPGLRCPLSHAPLLPAERRALLAMVEAAEREQRQQQGLQQPQQRYGYG